jgi:hypothetical protein
MPTIAELSDQVTELRKVHRLLTFVGECAVGTRTWTVQIARGSDQVELVIAEGKTSGFQDLIAPDLLATVDALTAQVESALQAIGLALQGADTAGSSVKRVADIQATRVVEVEPR